MKYWARFTLKMMVRLGLSAAGMAWVIGYLLNPYQGTTTIGALEMNIVSDPDRLFFGWCPTSYAAALRSTFNDEFGMPNIVPVLRWDLEPVAPGMRFWQSNVTHVVIEVDHWLLCLTFLVAMIATSARWRKREPAVEMISRPGRCERTR